jgi:adenosine deaminase
MPKAELHVHLEGTLEPENYLLIAQRNKIDVSYKSVDEVKKDLYSFHDLASFIEVYRRAISVLKTEKDFYDLTFWYLKKAASQGVLHTEIFFDFQSYSQQNIAAETIMDGTHRAIADAREQFDISASMILCFIRDMSEEDAFKTLELVRPFKEVLAIGLASVERGNPPSKFERVFRKAREYGYHVVAHAGEECGPEYIWQALQLLNAERIDHGIACMQDPSLIEYLKENNIPLTVCPLSNIALQRFKSIKDHPIKKMYDAGLMITINSDDPAFFGGYIDDNYEAVAEHLGFNCNELAACARNSILASFIVQQKKEEYLSKIDNYINGHKCD